MMPEILLLLALSTLGFPARVPKDEALCLQPFLSGLLKVVRRKVSAGFPFLFSKFQTW